MIPDPSSEVRLQAVGYFRKIADDIAGLYDAKRRIESVMYASSTSMNQSSGIAPSSSTPKTVGAESHPSASAGT